MSLEKKVANCGTCQHVTSFELGGWSLLDFPTVKQGVGRPLLVLDINGRKQMGSFG